MHLYLVVLSLLTTNCILGNFTSDKKAMLAPFILPNVADLKIVGGDTVNINEFPYQVSVQVLQYHACGGSIISKQFILTAAHCIIYHPSLYSVRAGSSYHASGGQVVKALSITPHPNYERPTQNYDIAVILLDGELIFGPTVDVIGLPKEDKEILEGTEAIVSGWGSTSRSYASQLQAITLPIVDRVNCAAMYAKVHNMVNENMICAGYEEGGKDACQGDSGGPLMVDSELIGIVSWGKGCASTYPGVYTNVPHLRSFIRDTTGV